MPGPMPISGVCQRRGNSHSGQPWISTHHNSLASPPNAAAASQCPRNQAVTMEKKAATGKYRRKVSEAAAKLVFNKKNPPQPVIVIGRVSNFPQLSCPERL